MKKSHKKLVIIIMVILGLTGCVGKSNVTSSEAETIEIQDESAQKESREEIKIDYPFEESQEYTLALAKIQDSTDEYELMLYGKGGEVLQQIPCGKLAEPIEFSYDGLAYYTSNNLEIFPSGSATGLLFIWKEDRFVPEAIEIPKYEEFQEERRYIITIDEEGDKLEKQAYLLNEEKNQVEKIWYLSLNRESGRLQIWDNMEDISLFDGIAQLDSEKNLKNAEYFDMFLWKDRYIMLDCEEPSLLPVWVGKDEEMKDPGYTKDYENRQSLLEEFGFENSEPVYQYFDQHGNLQLELYMDAVKENICGIFHDYILSKGLKKMDFQYGFTAHVMREEEWEDKDKYLLKNLNGFDGSEYEEWIKDFESDIAYRDDGRPDYFESTGRIDDQSERSTLLSIDFVYREDGTLYYRDYDHNSLAFETFLSYLNSYYDEKERVVYEKGYITHGHVEYYYIYEDENDKPTYCLYLDHNLGYVIPEIVRYH